MRRLTTPLLLLAFTMVTACEKGAEQRADDRTVANSSRAPGAIGGGLGTAGSGSPRPGRSGARIEYAEVVRSPAVGDVSGQVSAVAAAPVPSQAVLPGSLPVDATPPMVIRTGTATIKVDSLAPAIARLRTIAQQLGGYVGATSISIGSEQLRSATVELKVPAPRWNQLLEGIKPIGVLEHQEESAEDVGEEYVDVSARVANAQRLESRLIALLANRTGKLSDALEVEQQLGRVREEIERYQGRLRFLSSRAALSTMTVTLHEPAPVVGSHPGENPILDAFRTAWRIFVGFIAFLVASLGVLVPLALIVAVIWWLGRRFAAKRP